MQNAEFAVIGGTGVYDPALLESAMETEIETPYGLAYATIGEYKGKRIAFMPRHGKTHNVPPHQINYKANIQALYQLGVKKIFTTAAVGSMRLSMPPGSLVIIDQFIDFTKSRPTTFYEDGEKVAHVDMTDPYCIDLRQHLQKTAKDIDIPVIFGGTYACAEGPRFETPAEIRMYERLGGDVVGMTSVPETVLAKERGMCYATVAMVTNFSSGMSANPLSHQEVLDEMAKNVHLVRKLFFEAIATLGTEQTCHCHSAIGVM